jgi:hypothetical protein
VLVLEAKPEDTRRMRGGFLLFSWHGGYLNAIYNIAL